MAGLSVEDKGKGKRIITQFFRTMPGVQKTLMTEFDRGGYKGVHRIQHNLYPENATDIDSIDTLRKGLSMILQHIYGMPVEDKEGYFQDIVKCKTPSQVVRKEKEALLKHFYEDFTSVRDYLLRELIEDTHYGFMSFLCKKLVGEEEIISDMRSFKNHIRNLSDAIADRIAGGMSEEDIISQLKQYKQEFEEQQAEAEAIPVDKAEMNGETGEKRQIILNILGDDKYHPLRDFLIQKTTADPNFSTFQRYLNHILPSTSRIVAKDMTSFAEGLKMMKDFRDKIEQKLSANEA